MRLSITFIAALISVPLFGATVNSISFSQINYTQNGSVTVPNSGMGHFSVSYTQDAEDVSFLNVVQAAAGGPSWIIQNLPLPATAQTGTPSFPIGRNFVLSVANGTN